MFNLTGKIALVTGASGGIGAAIAKALYNAGASVALSGTRLEALQQLADELGDKSRIAIVAGNLSDPAAPEQILAAAEQALGGGVDIIVNNAGLTRDNLFMRMKDEDVTAVLDVNLMAAFRFARAGVKAMMKKRWGRIINITSVVGHTGNPGQANYAASKAALTGMSKAMAAEVAARNITINCVAPGFIATAMTDVLKDEQKAKLTSTIPAGRLGDATDVAAAVLFLASQEAGYVTGQTLHVNGGMAMI